MAGIMVSASKGVIGPFLDKLTELMEDNCTNLIGVSSNVVFLRDELNTINTLLEKLEDTDELNPLVKDWRNQVREMAYDIEDCIDDFMHLARSGDAKAGFINKVSHFLKTLRARLGAAKQIKELKTRLKEINERCKRYKFGDWVSKSSSVAVDRRLPALYNEAANLVGIEGPREDVIKLLTDMDQQLQVLSIVGFGGLGKTTLAMEVYNKIIRQFNINTFVSVSQRPNITRLLHVIQSKLGIGVSSPTFDVKDIIDSIRVYLQNKRYFVVVDDLWDVPTWEIIRHAFPKNDLGCRVIVTTRVEDVARWACCNHRQFIYRMKPLNDQDSRKLFFKRIFGSEDRCPSQFREVSAEILKKCGGLPLAIITIASLLANRSTPQRKEWETIQNSIVTWGSGTNSMLEGMRQILDLSYKDLPHHLRTCFLYLGMYPEDSAIASDDLIRQWVAEGFVHHLHGRDSENVAKSYFNELINRSLIRPETNIYGEVVSCRVHDMMLDLILSKCAEYNFINVAFNLEEIAGAHDYKVRRLLLDLRVGDAGDATVSGATASILSQLRSLQLFGESLSLFLLFKYLRVLILNMKNTRTGVNEIVDLTAIGQLFQLRYLKVLGDRTGGRIELPTEIQGLQYLATLHICHITEINWPSDIVRLPRLSHLIFQSGIRIPDGICSMKSLCTLQSFEISDIKSAKGLGELTNLRDLDLYSRKALTAIEIDALVTSLEKLRNLVSLCKSKFGPGHLYFYNDENDRLGSLSHPPLHIEKLDLGGWRLPRVPRWINRDLQNLCFLHLRVTEISTDEVRALGKLPSLIKLALTVRRCPRDSAAIVFDAAGFPAVESLEMLCCGDVMSHLRFEAGVLPDLHVLVLLYIDMEWSGTAPVGLEHLLNLRDIYLHPFSNGGTVNDDRSKRAFREALQAHRNCAALRLHYTAFRTTIQTDP
uniref:Uncharacterized protein n=1 Tax=Arundo donax TaxID=35708 RepID=A0A0A9CUD0_ARUDO